MWNEYAKDEGVVLEIDDSLFIPNQEMMMSKPCLYVGLLSDENLTKQIQDEYTFAGWAMLKGPMSKDAFELLEKFPQLFVRLIAMYLLAFVATRIKGKGFCNEEETRVIIQTLLPEITEFVKVNRDIIQESLHLDPSALIQAMQLEKIRQRDDKTVFYGNLYVPIDKLRAVYTRPEHQNKVEAAIRRLVPNEIPVHTINS